jgi:tripartite-type tricarboxylate transporter receptor subunit TctC
MNMKLPRRQFLHLAAGAAALPFAPDIACAQAYPLRPVRIVAGFPAGSTTDVVARLIGQWLQERLGQAFIVENRPGAGGTIATEAAVRAFPDGYTLLLVSTAHAINATLYNNLKFNILRDVAPIAAVVNLPNVMVVNPSISARTVPEFVAYAKANSGKLNMSSAGNGSSSHLAGELFKAMTRVNLVHVPYRGQPAALTDLLGGQVDVSFGTTASSIEYIRAGNLRALAVTTATRLEALPDVPALGEFVPGYEATTWGGLGAPRNTPAEVVEKLNKAINAGLADTKFRANLTEIGGIPLGGSPADFGKLIADETEKWGKLVKLAGIKPE